MTTTLLAVGAISLISAATGSRRCNDDSNEGWRCEGNLLSVSGLGGGDRK